jgi:hypothetical protein
MVENFNLTSIFYPFSPNYFLFPFIFTMDDFQKNICLHEPWLLGNEQQLCRWLVYYA